MYVCEYFEENANRCRYSSIHTEIMFRNREALNDYGCFTCAQAWKKCEFYKNHEEINKNAEQAYNQFLR